MNILTVGTFTRILEAGLLWDTDRQKHGRVKDKKDKKFTYMYLPADKQSQTQKRRSIISEREFKIIICFNIVKPPYSSPRLPIYIGIVFPYNEVENAMVGNSENYS